jgi:hypothetical protein
LQHNSQHSEGRLTGSFALRVKRDGVRSPSHA